MSFDVSWDVNKYKDNHESEEHWLLRKSFMERWKNDYSEDRLVCLARVFSNIEFMGCRYPNEVMLEVSRLSHDVAEEYRKIKKTKLQRTFVSASDAAEDRARGVKREGGVIKESPPSKSTKIIFVPQGYMDTNHKLNPEDITSDYNNKTNIVNNKTIELNNRSIKLNNKATVDNENKLKTTNGKDSDSLDPNEYLKNMLKIKCLDVRKFHDSMFNTTFGKFVLLIRTWTSKYGNLQSSCQACKVKLTNTFENNIFSMYINGQLVAEASGSIKAEAKQTVEELAWNRLQHEAVSVLIKEQWISDGDRISMSDVSGQGHSFGARVENSVATKMMKLMGWKGGGLGADAQGIAEPIQPHFQMVNRSGLGSSPDIRHLRTAGYNLMKRYIESDSFDIDLVFSSEFSKEERATLHKCAQNIGLASKSYSSDEERFLVVKKKFNPFSLVRAIVDKGGDTPKYRVFIPESRSLEKVLPKGDASCVDNKLMAAVCDQTYIITQSYALDKPNHYIHFDNPQILAKENRYVPRMLREDFEIRKHPNFNREDGWQVPPAWYPVIKLIKPQALRKPARPIDTMSSFCVQNGTH